MPTAIFEALAAAAFLLHLAFIAWVALGGVFVQRHRAVARLHLASLAYALVIQIGPWPCPLTLAEQYFMRRAGRTPYETGFLLHYLDRIVYPDVPQSWLIALTVTVCAGNLGLHARAWKRRAALRLRRPSADGLDSHRPHQP
jgi:hypothetical protein